MLTCNLQRQDLFYSRQGVIQGSQETRSILLQVGCYIGFSRDKIYSTPGRMLYRVLQRQDLFYSRQDVIQGSLETRYILLQVGCYIGFSRDKDLFNSRQYIIQGSLEIISILLHVDCYIGYSINMIYSIPSRILYRVLQRQDLYYSR